MVLPESGVHMHAKSTSKSPWVKVEGSGIGTRPGDGGRVCQLDMEGDGSPRWVVVTKHASANLEGHLS